MAQDVIRPHNTIFMMGWKHLPKLCAILTDKCVTHGNILAGNKPACDRSNAEKLMDHDGDVAVYGRLIEKRMPSAHASLRSVFCKQRGEASTALLSFESSLI